MKLVLILLGMLLAQPVWAEWEKWRTVETATYFWNPARVRKTDEGRRVWTMTSYQKGMATHGSEMILYEFDCDGERERILAWFKYSGPNGTGTRYDIADFGPEVTRWKVIPPAATIEPLLNAVCKLPLE
jgi:hypothetical protein